MYGTVARMRLKPGAEERLRALMQEYDAGTTQQLGPFGFPPSVPKNRTAADDRSRLRRPG